MLFFWLSASITYLIDRISKFLVLKWEGSFLSLTSFLNLVKVWNRGMAFGVLSEAGTLEQILLIIIGLGVLIVVYFWAKTSDRFIRITLGILWGAGLGNLTDRVLYFAVLDFIDLHLRGYHWPAFNIADIGITLSMAILSLKLFFKKF